MTRHQLIDFGEGRKLESFAGYLIDRPSPAADSFPRRVPRRWRDADARFDARERRWHLRTPFPDALAVDCGGFIMPIRLTPYGHVGLFPEQAANWAWLARRRESSAATSPAPAALNLFAYTGAASMALLAAGYHVAHVDAAKPNVEAAKRAVEANRFGDRPIRFLVDDAMKFAAREIRRGRRYHTVVLDPPAYGHGPKGRTWRIARDLWPLLDLCFELVAPESFRLLVTGHSPDVGPEEIVAHARKALARKALAREAPSREGLAREAPSREGLAREVPSREVPSREVPGRKVLGRRASAGPAAAADGEPIGLRTESGRSQLNDLAGRHLDAGFYVRIVSERA